jgi:flagellar FliL protein
MKQVIIIVIALVLLGGGGGAGWWFFLREPPPEDAAAALSEPVKPLDPNAQQVFSLDPFVLPILRNGQVTQHLTVVLRVELNEPENRDEFKKAIPRLRDALFSELHGIFAFRHIQQGGETLPIVRDRLVAAVNAALGEGRVKGVFLEFASRRSMGEG